MTTKFRHPVNALFISASDILAHEFCNTLAISCSHDDAWWIDYGGTFAFRSGEMFIDAGNMMLVIESGMEWDDFFEWYWQWNDFDHETFEQKPNRVNLRSWLTGARPDNSYEPNKKTYISMCKPDPNKCTLFWREKGDCYSPELTDKLKGE